MKKSSYRCRKLFKIVFSPVNISLGKILLPVDLPFFFQSQHVGMHPVIKGLTGTGFILVFHIMMWNFKSIPPP
jgi:hypothetical protein